MNYPDYYSPVSMTEAINLLEQHANSGLIAGGTDLVPKMRARLKSPATLVDLKGLGLDHIVPQGPTIIIGACVTHSQIIHSTLVNHQFPMLAEACRQVGSPPIRNLGTLGGNLANASPAADTAPPLLVLDAKLVLLGKNNSERVVPLEEFFIAPGRTILKPGEILREIIVPNPGDEMRTCFIKMGQRNAMAIAVISVAVCLSVTEGGSIGHARIALGSVAPTPVRAFRTEEFLTGQQADEGTIERAAEIVKNDISPITDLRASREFRLEMSKVLVKRALFAAWKSQSKDGKNG